MKEVHEHTHESGLVRLLMKLASLTYSSKWPHDLSHKSGLELTHE
jgi:hypothetical protein